MAPNRTRRGAALLILAAAFSAMSVACDGSGADKAGGSTDAEPVVLTLATYDERDPAEFAAAVERLSGGSIRIDIVLRPYGDPDYELHTVEAVRRGEAQLGVVGARVWDTMGVSSFRALLAPFLIGSLALERRVLDSELPARMLEGVQRAGVVGVAVLPGELRIPWGISHPLVRLQDYEGARVGTGRGNVAQATFRALGATAKRFAPGDPTGLDGAEFEPWVIAFAGDQRQAGVLATNVILWPRPQTIVMNRAAFEALTSSQQEILRRAGRDALEPALERIVREEERLLDQICQRRRLSLVTASPGDLQTLREAVRPVYAELERDEQTEDFIAAIREMRDRVSEAAGPARCGPLRPVQKSPASRLEGSWQVTLTREDLVGVGLGQELPAKWSATVVYEFANGRFKGNSTPRETGTYEIDGDVLRLIFETGRFLQLGEVYALRWSVYRDTLTFSPVPGSQQLQAITIKPWTRIR